MKQGLLLALFLMFSGHTWSVSKDVLEETIYHDFQKSIQSQEKSKSFLGLTGFEQSLYVDALWNLAEENSPEALELLNQDAPLHYLLAEKLKLGILRMKYGKAQ